MDWKPTEVIIGTRGSTLARYQTDLIAGALQSCMPYLPIEIRVITTSGDIFLEESLMTAGGKGLFTNELEHAIQTDQIDLAVHSLKDLPTLMPEGLTLGAIPQRANPADVLVSRSGLTLSTLPAGARIGTSSRRRAAQLLHFRPDLQMISIRGNVDSRIKKVQKADGDYDAIILAYAGLERLNFLDAVTEVLPMDVMLPAPGQAALAVECRDDPDWISLIEPIDCLESRFCVTAERAFLHGLGGGCALPVAAFAEIATGRLNLKGRVIAVDGNCQINLERSLPMTPDVRLADIEIFGLDLAQEGLDKGAGDLLKGCSDAE